MYVSQNFYPNRNSMVYFYKQKKCYFQKYFKYGIVIRHFNFYRLGLGSSATTGSCDCQAGVKIFSTVCWLRAAGDGQRLTQEFTLICLRSGITLFICRLHTHCTVKPFLCWTVWHHKRYKYPWKRTFHLLYKCGKRVSQIAGTWKTRESFVFPGYSHACRALIIFNYSEPWSKTIFSS